MPGTEDNSLSTGTQIMQKGKTISLIHYRRAGDLADHIRARCAQGEWERLDIDSLCKKFTASETVLTRSFRQRYRVTVHAFIISEKMRFAKTLLMQDGLTISEISHQSGYTSLSNFSRDFTRLTGRSPLAWRNCSVCHGDAVDMRLNS